MTDKSTELKEMIRRTIHGQSQLDGSCQDVIDQFAATHEKFQQVRVNMGHLLTEDKFGIAQVPLRAGKLDLEAAYLRVTNPSVRDTVFLAIQNLKEDQ